MPLFCEKPLPTIEDGEWVIITVEDAKNDEDIEDLRDICAAMMNSDGSCSGTNQDTMKKNKRKLACRKHLLDRKSKAHAAMQRDWNDCPKCLKKVTGNCSMVIENGHMYHKWCHVQSFNSKGKKVRFAKDQ